MEVFGFFLGIIGLLLVDDLRAAIQQWTRKLELDNDLKEQRKTTRLES